MTTFYHGTPTPDIVELEPRKDPRTGVEAVFVAADDHAPEIFSLMPKRHEFTKTETTRGGEFIEGEIIGKLPLNDIGYVYTVEADPESVVEREPGRFHLTAPAKVVDVRQVTKEEVLAKGWKVKEASSKELDLSEYLERYKDNDPAHGLDHIEDVRQRAADLAAAYAPEKALLVDLAAAMHDMALSEGREDHENRAADMVLDDPYLQENLTKRDLHTVAEAVRQHRASSGKPRTDVARIVSDADRLVETNPAKSLRRAISWGEHHMPELSEDEQLLRAYEHLKEKYGPGGTARRVYFPESLEQIEEKLGLIINTEGDLDKLRTIMKAASRKEATVLSAVPEEAIDLVKKFGLLSSEAVLENPEVLKAILANRKGTDWEETVEEFKERIKEKLKDELWGDSMKGPSVFFSEPPKGRLPGGHPINKLKTRLIRINLERLLGDFPDTRIAGTELKPYDPEGPEHQGRERHHDIDLEKVLEYSKMDPSLLWENYKGSDTYAGDVPHAQIITPMGIIPPEYIEYIMNKKSSAAPDNSPVNSSMTGPEAIAAAIDTYSVEDIEDEAVKLLQAGTKTKRPLATRLLRYVKGFRRNKLNPSDYIIRNVPVIPPKFRPFNVVGDSFVPGAANELYRDLFSVLKTHNDVEKVLGRGASGDHKLNVYDSVKAVYGFGEPVLPKTKQRGVGGFLKQITGSTAKFSFFQRKLISKPVDMTGRAVIGVDPDLDLDQIGLPYSTAFKIYSPFIQRRLVRGGMPRTEAIKAVLEKAPTALKTLQDLVKERPVMYSREPAWHKFNVVAGYPKLIEGETFMISPLVTSGLNADFDGDTINVHVPGLPEAVEEAKEKLLPSKMLFGIRGRQSVMATPSQELILGLYTAQHRPASNKFTFSSEAEAVEAIKNNKVKLSDEIEIE